jgi:glyoxylase-like metal-dependent hydrolase (beta-lactamase superfamily II)
MEVHIPQNYARKKSPQKIPFNMIQLFDSVYLLDGTVGKRPIYLPLLVGEWGCLLLDTGCSYHVNDLILPALDRLELRPEQLRYIINTHPDSDHVGGNARMKRWSPTAILCCGDPLFVAILLSLFALKEGCFFALDVVKPVVGRSASAVAACCRRT